jgi:hypothetical protein
MLTRKVLLVYRYTVIKPSRRGHDLAIFSAWQERPSRKLTLEFIPLACTYEGENLANHL